MNRFSFTEYPLLVYWELTRSCELACIHCRAEAMKRRHPDELSFKEIKYVLSELAEKPVHLIMTGGDPILRPDIFKILEYSTSLGISTSITPAGTMRLDPGTLKKIKDTGVTSLGLSLDGSTPKLHDNLRKVDGSFLWTTKAIEEASNIGLPVQINTMVTSETLSDIPEVFKLLHKWPIMRWALFFLIPTGRGASLNEITAEESERFLSELYQMVRLAPFDIKTTEAHHFRRISLTQGKLKSQRIMGIRDGNGIMFISHTGDVYPSGFLPIKTGNVREKKALTIYQDSPIFQALRNPDKFSGKCGQCEFRYVCGGSRARAYAVSGDYLGSDPLCLYQPEHAQAQA